MIWIILGLLTVGGLVFWGVRFRPGIRKAAAFAGLAAKQLCSLVYISGLDPERARQLYIDPVLGPARTHLKVCYDDKNKRVEASYLGIWRALAEYREGIGCTLIFGRDKKRRFSPIALPHVPEKPLSNLDPEEISLNFNPLAVETALDRALNEADQTLAVAVLFRGKVLAERYAPGISAKTPLPGWSMAKSITATLVGCLVKRGTLDLTRSGIVPEWNASGHPGAPVTLDHLLRMTSGLDVLEDQSGSDPNSRLIFAEPDAAAFAARCGLKAAPDTHWEYMSGSTVLASRAVVEAAGGTLQSSQWFMREALFAPIGAPSFLFETDAAGTFIGSSYALANTHDWAKFGQLYLNQGKWEGEQILPEGWGEYVSSHTPLSGKNSYGAGFWTAEHAILDGIPKDLYYANGFQGQNVLIIPSLEMVIVRLGASLGPTGVWELVRGLMAARK